MSVSSLNQGNFALVSSEQVLKLFCVILKEKCLRFASYLSIGRIVISIIHMTEYDEFLSFFSSLKYIF